MKRFLLFALLLLLILTLTAGTAAGQFSYTDAQKLASLESDSLLAPDTLVARIDGELALIRAHTPEMSAIHASCVSPLPGFVTVLMTPEAMGEYLAGRHAEMNQLDAQFGMSLYVGGGQFGFVTLNSALPYKPERLAEAYLTVTGVTDAFPEVCGGDPPDQIAILAPGVYRFRHGWGDCPCGCPWENVFVFRIEDGVVTLVAMSTTDVTVPRMTWGKLKGLYR